MLPEVRAVELATMSSTATGASAGLPICGIAGDQQAALFGQACFVTGMSEEHVRHRIVRAHERRAPTSLAPVDGLLTTVAWTLDDGVARLRLEGARSS